MEKLTEKIIGSWQLISWTFKNEKGEIVNYFGENPQGILMYDKNGKMNAQLMKSNRKKFESEAFNGGTGSEMSEAFTSYLAYYGDYIENNPGEITHHVTGSLYPNWVGMNQFRYGKLNGDILTLSTQPILSNGIETVFEVSWKKINS